MNGKEIYQFNCIGEMNRIVMAERVKDCSGNAFPPGQKDYFDNDDFNGLNERFALQRKAWRLWRAEKTARQKVRKTKREKLPLPTLHNVY